MTETTPKVAPQPSWKALFHNGGALAAGVSINVFVLTRHGEPLLVLPRRGIPVRLALSLYQAQTFRARLAKASWTAGLSFGLPLGALRDSVEINLHQKFVHFLRSTCPACGVPSFSLLAGNPHAPGRRFLLLLFDEHRRPLAVIKAGVSAVADKLIRKEVTFLEKVPEGTPGMPKLRGTLFEETVSAFATDFVPGRSPRASEDHGLVPILRSWLHPSRRIPMGALTAWQRLSSAAANDPLFRRIDHKIRNIVLRPTIFHGDFAPWNIKISETNDAWMVLDWERGELEGPPAWDWFHYIIQRAVLVQKEEGQQLLRRVESLLSSEPFLDYARESGILGLERDLLLSYLLHCRDVLRPAEGSPRILELLALLARV